MAVVAALIKSGLLSLPHTDVRVVAGDAAKVGHFVAITLAQPLRLRSHEKRIAFTFELRQEDLHHRVEVHAGAEVLPLLAGVEHADALQVAPLAQAHLQVGREVARVNDGVIDVLGGVDDLTRHHALHVDFTGTVAPLAIDAGGHFFILVDAALHVIGHGIVASHALHADDARKTGVVAAETGRHVPQLLLRVVGNGRLIDVVVDIQQVRVGMLPRPYHPRDGLRPLVDGVGALQAVLLDVQRIVLPEGMVIELVDRIIDRHVVAILGSRLLPCGLAKGLPHARVDVRIVHIAVARDALVHAHVIDRVVEVEVFPRLVTGRLLLLPIAVGQQDGSTGQEEDDEPDSEFEEALLHSPDENGESKLRRIEGGGRDNSNLTTGNFVYLITANNHFIPSYS